MKKEFVTYEQALALKELGFDERCFSYYEDINLYTSNGFNCNYGPIINGEESALAPLIQQAFRFFRERYGLAHKIDIGSARLKWFISTTRIATIGSDWNYYDLYFDTYEQAEQECLDKLIEIAKESKL